ncbi:MAG: B12-binding domain-containing radical SAM protein [Planctomycetes bacterium]|nr:B12-binding domain-containing radical SAM protein [Planctomycetota bacterium]
MKIVLILPAARHLRVTQENQNVPRRKMLRFSVLSLTTIAALTPGEHQVKIVDENVEPLDLNVDADVVGITFMTGLAPRAYELARHFRSRGIVTVAGGFHPTLCTQETTKYFDIVVAGQAEGVWGRVLEDIQKGCFQKIYRGDCNQDLAVVPAPRRELLKRTGKYYMTTNAVQTGRGCQHMCKFCSVTAFFNHQHHNRPLENVLAELRMIPRHFMFIDDNIIADKDYAKALFRAMIPIKKIWISQCSIELADDDELMDLAYRAGCRGVFIGIESLDENNLSAVEKGFNDSWNYYARVAKIRKHGIGVQAGMIVGLDSDDVTVFERNLRFLQKSGIDAMQLAILTPQPGTPLREEFEKAGRIIDNDWANYDYRHVVIKPRKMTIEQLQAGADWLYARYYRLDRIVWRALRSVFTIGPVATYLAFRLGLNYRYDNIREGIVGFNPAGQTKESRVWQWTVKTLAQMKSAAM